jgi:transposase, IS30 family
MGHLSLEQRYTIAKLRKQNFSLSKIATIIEKDKSVISRELHRNCDKRNGEYKVSQAHAKAVKRKKDKPKIARFTKEIKARVDEYLNMDYSPEQIVGYRKVVGQECVSHERIYQYLWQDKKTEGELYLHLRTKGKKYASRGNKNGKRGQIIERVDIDERPVIVEKRNVLET